MITRESKPVNASARTYERTHGRTTRKHNASGLIHWTGGTYKLGKDCVCSFGEMLSNRLKDRQTDRQMMLIAILRSAPDSHDALQAAG